MVAGILEKNIPELHFDMLHLATKKAFLLLAEHADWLASGQWYLAGGTSLTLQVGHRTSVDLDFFSTHKDFDSDSLERKISLIGQWQPTLKEFGTLYGELVGAKISFIAYPFFIPSVDTVQSQNISLLKPDDIAVMKIIAISQRGRKRDFVDLYWYCQHIGNLEEIFSRLPKQYPQEHNFSHILKSFTYFDDAEGDPMPQVNFKITWDEVKAYFLKEVPRLTRVLLDLC